MFALALKDFLVLDRRAWPLAGSVVFVLFFYSNPAIGLALSLVPALYLASWSAGLEFAAKSDAFTACLPVRPARVVAARFLSPVAAWAAWAAASFLVWALRAALGPFIPAAALPGMAALSLAGSLVSTGAFLAAYHLFGFQNARWANFVVFFGIGALGPVMNAIAPGTAATGIPALNVVTGGSAAPALYLGALAVGAAAYAAAYLASVAAYSRREF